MPKVTRDYDGYKIVTRRFGPKWSFALYDPNRTKCYCGWCKYPRDMYDSEEEAVDAAFLQISLCIDKDGIKFK